MVSRKPAVHLLTHRDVGRFSRTRARDLPCTRVTRAPSRGGRARHRLRHATTPPVGAHRARHLGRCPLSIGHRQSTLPVGREGTSPYRFSLRGRLAVIPGRFPEVGMNDPASAPRAQRLPRGSRPVRQPISDTHPRRGRPVAKGACPSHPQWRAVTCHRAAGRFPPRPLGRGSGCRRGRTSASASSDVAYGAPRPADRAAFPRRTRARHPAPAARPTGCPRPVGRRAAGAADGLVTTTSPQWVPCFCSPARTVRLGGTPTAAPRRPR